MRKLTFYTFQQPSTNTASSQSQSMGRTLSKSNRKGGGQASKSNTVMKKKKYPLWSGNIQHFRSKKILKEEEQEAETGQKDDWKV